MELVTYCDNILANGVLQPEQSRPLAADSDVYMQVETPRAAAAVAVTTESAYLQIGEAGAGVQKQNPLFVEETGFGFGEDG